MELNLKIWTMEEYKGYLKHLENLQEEKYRNFNRRIVSSKYPMLGIRIPLLRKIANEIKKGNYTSFLSLCSTTYLEEILIEGFIIGKIMDEVEFDNYLFRYLDKIDNWMVCDSFCNSLKIIKKNPDKYLKICIQLGEEKSVYKVRVGLVLLLNFFVKEQYLDTIFTVLDNISLDTYYVNMASAWLLAECMIKYSCKTKEYLNKTKMNSDALKKAFQKMRDSKRLSSTFKNSLPTYR